MNKILRFLINSFICSGLLFFLPGNGFSQTISTKGLITGWATINTDSSIKPLLGLRYIPEFSLAKSISSSINLDAEFSFNLTGSGRIYSLENIPTKGKGKPYRMWLRFSSSQFEARVGLQKINFGSATLLRPLMWFDSIDPRDPLQLTDGVYALLFRYYFLNNTNIWVWGLYGNNNPKGWETVNPKHNSPEFGGRIQTPLGNGELAFSYHHRRIEIPELLDIAPENRLALDGKWDIGIGIWFESVLTHQSSDLLPFPWQSALNIGLDYTFGLGNGLNVTAEHFIYGAGREAFQAQEDIKFSALALNYPMSLLDNITGIFYYDWDNKEFYNFLSWQRTYDRWSFYLMGFWNPESFQIYQTQTGNNLFSGQGIQFMVVFNY